MITVFGSISTPESASKYCTSPPCEDGSDPPCCCAITFHGVKSFKKTTHRKICFCPVDGGKPDSVAMDAFNSASIGSINEPSTSHLHASKALAPCVLPRFNVPLDGTCRFCCRLHRSCPILSERLWRRWCHLSAHGPFVRHTVPRRLCLLSLQPEAEAGVGTFLTHPVKAAGTSTPTTGQRNVQGEEIKSWSYREAESWSSEV